MSSRSGHDRYEHTPQTGSWFYVTDQASIATGELLGAWVPVGSDDVEVLAAASRAAGRPLTMDDLVVIDQIGLGGEMVDDDCFAVQEAL